MPNSRPNAGYLILSFSNPNNKGKPAVEIWDLNNQKKLHKYIFDFNEIENKIGIKIDYDKLRFNHPWVLDDGGLLLNASIGLGKANTLLKFDKCGKLLISNNKIKSHHSIEVDKFGNIYSPSYISEVKEERQLHKPLFIPDGFVVLDMNLNLIDKYSLLEIYRLNNLLPDIYGNQSLLNDPFHLNDVQPYQDKDGNQYVILSMKGHSRIMALEMRNKRVPWFIDRAFSLQHDVDILDQDDNSLAISIFDNNSKMFGDRGIGMKNYGNRIAFFSNLPKRFADYSESVGDSMKYKKYELNYFKFDNLNKNLRPKTINEGLSDISLLNNSLMVEETNFGRLLEVDLTDGKILWQYLNRSVSNNDIYMMGWSRRIFSSPIFLEKNQLNICKSKD